MNINPLLKYLFIIILITLIPVNAISQEKSEKEKKKELPKVHSVGRAAIYSAALPGLGQAYNRKYWKIPIVYAGFAVIGYFVVTNNQEYTQFKDAYIYVANGDTVPTDNPYVDKYNQTQLKDAMDFYRRNRDLSIIIGALWYTINILEAYVDAHFFDYDISDDLSLHISPSAVNVPTAALRPAPGLRISLKF